MSSATPRMLVVVAHPDDETFGCGSTIAGAATRGVNVVVACATRGEAGTPAPGSGIEVADLPHERETELRGAAALLGACRVELFDWRDSDMEGTPAPGALCATPLDEVAAVVRALIDDTQPDVIVTLDATDGHRDHAHIRDATLLAAEHATWRTPRIYLQCLPQSLMREWMALMEQRNPGSEYLALGELGTREELITTVLDNSEHYDLRRRAIAVHRSQVSPFEDLPDDLRRRFLSTDHLRRVHPAWPGGPIETELFPA